MTAANRPLFSIIIPTRNRSSLFAVALQSVLEQRLRDFEVIVVNDGLSDEHALRYRELEPTDNRPAGRALQGREGAGAGRASPPAMFSAGSETPCKPARRPKFQQPAALKLKCASDGEKGADLLGILVPGMYFDARGDIHDHRT
ncbi:MAG: glycosyltransferase [Alphaproteobacteria bacterium]|nr:glycosyltransferase [Alphaproteobacteria bacterium]